MATLFWNEHAGFYLREVTELQRQEVSAMERRIYGSRFTHQTRQHAEFLRTSTQSGWGEMSSYSGWCLSTEQNRTEQRSASSRKNRTLWPDIPALSARLKRCLLQQETAWKKAANHSTRIEHKLVTAHKSFIRGWGSDYDTALKGILFRNFAEDRVYLGKSPERNPSNLLELLLGKHSKFCKDACNLRKKWRGFLD